MELIPKKELYLEHHGVKGMRWGVRKQEDGGTAKTGSAGDDTHGYKPKKPGVRAGGTRLQVRKGKKKEGVGRLTGARLDANQRQLARNTRVSEGRGSVMDKAKVLATSGVGKAIVNGGLKELSKKNVASLTDRASRIEKGQLTIRDRWGLDMNISTADLFVSRRDDRG